MTLPSFAVGRLAPRGDWAAARPTNVKQTVLQGLCSVVVHGTSLTVGRSAVPVAAYTKHPRSVSIQGSRRDIFDMEMAMVRTAATAAPGA